MTARAIGAATRPPVASLPRSRRSRRRRRPRPAGRRPGANAGEPGVRGDVVGGLRGAGLAGDGDARDLRRRAGPGRDDLHHHVPQRARGGLRTPRCAAPAATPPRPPRGRGCGRSGRGTAPSARRRWRSRPRPSPSAAASRARRAGRWRRAPSAGGPGPRGSRLGVDPQRDGRAPTPNPNRSACSRSASAPRSRPSWANGVLQEIRSASASVTVPPPPHEEPPKLPMVALELGSGRTSGAGSGLSAVEPGLAAPRRRRRA